MSRWSRPDWLILLLFALLVALFYWRIWTPHLADRQSFPPGDFALQFWAFSTFEVRELSAGRLPLWNPYTFAGVPFWADVQTAVFYPPSLLTLLLSAPWGFSLFALELEAIAHFWLAATFMYLFIRHLTHSRPAAFSAALTFTFSGYLTSYPSQQLAVLEADVWLPLMLFFIHRAQNNQSSNPPALRLDSGQALQPFDLTQDRPSLLLAGLAWGLALLAGHPQSALIIAYISTAYLFFLGLTTSPNTQYAIRYCVLRIIPAWFIIFITGLGLAAIQFIPAAEYTLLSVRAEGSYEAMSGGFPLVDVIQFLLPGQISFYSPLYLGIAGLILAGWVTFAQPNRHVIFWAILAVVTLLISFGGNTFVYTPLYLTTPGFSLFRGQERWALATAFSLCVLVGYGFKALQIAGLQVAGSRVASSRGVGSRVAGSKLASSKVADAAKGHSSALATQYAIRNTPSPITPRSDHLPITILHPPHRASILQSLTTSLLLSALLFTLLCFYGLNDTGWTPDSPFFKLLGAATLLTVLLTLTWLLWNIAPHLSPTLLSGLTAALICFDLFTVNWQTNLYPQLPEWHTQIPAVIAAIKRDAATLPHEPYRVYNEYRVRDQSGQFTYDNYGVPFEIEDLGGASPLRPARYDQFLAPPMPIERAWELLNVKYVITWRQELFVPSTIIYEEPTPDAMTYVHRLNQVGPRAWLVTQTQIAADATILQTLTDPTFDPYHTALLEPTATTHNLQLTNRPSDNNTKYEIRNTFSPTHLTYQISTSTPALLIFSEPDYPGWQATVNGEPVPLLRANYILRAVPVPAGEDRVELTFRPLSFTVGAIISGITLIVVLTLLWVRRKS